MIRWYVVPGPLRAFRAWLLTRQELSSRPFHRPTRADRIRARVRRWAESLT